MYKRQVKGLIQSPLFFENFISSDYDTLVVQRESESGIERYATTTCRISSAVSYTHLDVYKRQSLGILLSTSTLIIQGSALTFGLLAVLMVFLVSKVNGRTELFTLVLSGVIIQALFDALVSLIKYVSDPQEKLPAITVWLMGSLASSSYKDIIVSCVIILPCIAVLLTLRWKMNLLSLDEEEARSLGVNVHRLRSVVIVLSTLMTGVTVSLCGVIGWIGLVIPHVGRMLVGNDHRALLPASALLGALYLLLIDTIARTATAAEIPLSILTAIIGAPFFAWMLRKTSGGST